MPRMFRPFGLVGSAAILVVFLVGAMALGLDWWVCLPEEVTFEYVGRQACEGCHEEASALWKDSHHDLAMDPATPEKVLGDFDDATFVQLVFQDLHRLEPEHIEAVVAELDAERVAVAMQHTPWGRQVQATLEAAVLGAFSNEQRQAFDRARANPTPVRPCDAMTAQREIGDIARRLLAEGTIEADFALTSRMFRQGERYLVSTDNGDGEMETFEVKYVLGFNPLQQYLVEFPDGRIQCLPLAWDTIGKGWFHLYPGEPIPHDDPLHWTGALQNFNYMCAECHTTNLQKNFDVEENAYHTTWSEMDVSCETCHGPGSLHVKLAESGGVFWDRRHGFGLPNLKDPDSHVVIETCAPCHARRRVVAPNFPAGGKFMDHYVLEMIDSELYYADGQILDEDYVYGSFVQSLMYRNEVRCTDCHDPHSARVKFTDNRLCGQCHEMPKYDTPQHHHHPDATKPGTLCVECHMPETTYMVVDPRRDHSIRIPRPDLTVSLDIPNACNGCHQDVDKGETPAWATDLCETWYGKPKDEHFAAAFAAGRQGRPEAVRMLDRVTRNQDRSAMVRASAIALLGRYGDNDRARAAAFRGLEDPEGLVRVAAARTLDELPAEQLCRRLVPLLDDPLRAVRSEAARLTVRIPQTMLSSKDRRTRDAAIEEYLEGQRSLADQPGSHLNMAVMFSDLGRTDEAKASYRTALRLDPTFLPARVNLAMLLNNTGDQAGAEKELREVIRLNPGMGEVRYSLALLLAEDATRLAEAVTHLDLAARQVETNPRIYYNLGLARQKLEQWAQAEEALTTAVGLAPKVPDFRFALALLHAQQEQWPKALACAEELVRRDPGNPQWVSLVKSFRQASQQQQ